MSDGRPYDRPTDLKTGPIPNPNRIVRVALAVWNVLSGTKLTGVSINNGTPLPVTLSLRVDNNAQGTVWIVGLVEDAESGKTLKMVKIRVTGANTYTWIATRYTQKYDSGCAKQDSFSASCFESSGNVQQPKDVYPVQLVASKFSNAPGMIWHMRCAVVNGVSASEG